MDSTGHDIPGPAGCARRTQCCGNRLMDLADKGVSRVVFLEGVVQTLVEQLSCAEVRLVIKERGRRFFVGLKATNGSKVRLHVIKQPQTANRAYSWTAGSSSSAERLCSELVAGRMDTSKPWVTDLGSLWIQDPVQLPFPDLTADDCPETPGICISPGFCDSLIMCVAGVRGTIGLLQLSVDKHGFFSRQDIGFYEHMARMLGLAIDHRNLIVALRERVKELTCLYGIVRLVARAESSLDDVLHSVVQLLPPGWLYPEVAEARIVLDGNTFSTVQADAMINTLTADIVLANVKRGTVQVGYTEEKPTVDEGPFLMEERKLIDTIARELAFIIEQKTHEDEKARLHEQLRHADRLATIGQLAAGVAHELNEPLANIMGFAQLAAKQPGIPEQTEKDLSRIVSASLHARAVIKELLIFARETAPIKIQFNLNELIRDGLFFLESRFDKAGISLRCNLEQDLPDMVADRSQMLQVLTNLVVNAVQAMPHGGCLTITTALKEEDIVLTVEDSGEGMDPDTASKVFNPFFTTKEVNEGTGLGLSVVHGIIAAHGGTVSVESAPTEGSRFVIRVPRGNHNRSISSPDGDHG